MLDRKVYSYLQTNPSIAPRIWIVLGWTTFLYLGYQLTNHNQFFPANELPLFEFEKQIPFLVWTVVPYFLLIGGMYLPVLIRTPEHFMKCLYAFGIAVTINYTIFIFYPTVYPRPELPDPGSISGWLYHWLVGIDTPANCFPSGHVCVPGIGIWYVSQEHPEYRVLLWSVFALFVLTVLTTKQHYAVDILGGLFTAAIGIKLADRVFENRIASMQE